MLRVLPYTLDRATYQEEQQWGEDQDSSCDKLNYTYHKEEVLHSLYRWHTLHHDCHPINRQNTITVCKLTGLAVVILEITQAEVSLTFSAGGQTVSQAVKTVWTKLKTSWTKSYAQPVTLLCAWPLMKTLVFPFLTSYKAYIVRMQFKVKWHSELIAQNANSQEFILTIVIL